MISRHSYSAACWVGAPAAKSRVGKWEQRTTERRVCWSSPTGHQPCTISFLSLFVRLNTPHCTSLGMTLDTSKESIRRLCRYEDARCGSKIPSRLSELIHRSSQCGEEVRARDVTKCHRIPLSSKHCCASVQLSLWWRQRTVSIWHFYWRFDSYHNCGVCGENTLHLKKTWWQLPDSKKFVLRIWLNNMKKYIHTVHTVRELSVRSTMATTQFWISCQRPHRNHPDLGRCQNSPHMDAESTN